jgi:hypothetical protein
MLKNKKFTGKIQQQYIRVKSKPLISEVDMNFDSQQNKINQFNNKETKYFILTISKLCEIYNFFSNLKEPKHQNTR